MICRWPMASRFGNQRILSLPYWVHSLVTLDRFQCSFHRPESEAGSIALLDESSILLDDVVHVG
jgi:hypothetical protein